MRGFLRVNIHGVARFRPVTLRHKALESADGDRSIELTAAAGGFTGVAANPAANRGERVRTTGVAVGFLVPAFRDQRHIAAGLRVNRTGLHAGEVRFQPVQVNEFCPLLTQVAAPLDSQFKILFRPRVRQVFSVNHFVTVMLTVADPPETETDCDAGLPASLHVFSV